MSIRVSRLRHRRERSESIQGRRAALLTIATTIYFFFAMPAHAHTGAGATHGFAFGFEHPFGGLDHLAAMLAVGGLGARMRGRRRLAAPLAFVTFMTLGAMLGELDIPPNLLQALTFNSVIMLGVMLTTRLGANALIGLFLVGAFGVMHGLAHGAEAPQGAEGFAFLCGLVAATVLGHALGFLAALAATRCRDSLRWTRAFR
jgi:urease accessory protein